MQAMTIYNLVLDNIPKSSVLSDPTSLEASTSTGRKRTNDEINNPCRRMVKAPPLISLDLHLSATKCNCWTYDVNIGPKFKKSELYNIVVVKYV